MKKIGFFFGAGAEGKGNFELMNGIEFMRNSYLSSTHSDKVTKLLKSSFTNNYFNEKFKYNSSTFFMKTTTTSILKRWIMYNLNNKDIYNLYHDDIKGILNKTEYKEYKEDIFTDKSSQDDSLEGKTDKPEKDIESRANSIETSFFEILTNKENSKKHLSIIKTSILKELFVDVKSETLEFKTEFPTGISHILDGYFHTLIDPVNFGRNKFSKIFNYYWMIFFSIYDNIIYLMKQNNYIEHKNELGIDSVLVNLEELYKLDSDDLKKLNDTSYYNLIADKLESNHNKSSKYHLSGVITSNYYRFPEIITEPCNISYVHGKLSWFEFPEFNQTVDLLSPTVNNFGNDKIFFPFIMGQSYVKPIISSLQVREYYKMKKILDDSDVMIVLGHSISPDDFHLNAYLREFVVKDNKFIIYVTSDSNDLDLIKKNLKLDNNFDRIECCVVNYHKNTTVQIINELFKKIDEVINDKLSTS